MTAVRKWPCSNIWEQRQQITKNLRAD